jgi:formylmethanofuran--tetrahydromethanopterin N-formyltransferase
LRGLTESQLAPDIEAVLEIVIDGLTAEDVRLAMRAGIEAVCRFGASGGVRRISAGNYGGKLGKFHFPLREIMA